MGFFKKLLAFVFVQNQVNPAMLPVFVLTKSKRFPGRTVRIEYISLNSSFVMLVQRTDSGGSLFDSVHFGHMSVALPLGSTKI